MANEQDSLPTGLVLLDGMLARNDSGKTYVYRGNGKWAVIEDRNSEVGYAPDVDDERARRIMKAVDEKAAKKQMQADAQVPPPST